MKKLNFFSCEHRVYILKSFKSHIEKIKHSSSACACACSCVYKGSLAMRKNTFEKKKVSTGFCQVVRVTSQPGLTFFFFCQSFTLLRLV